MSSLVHALAIPYPLESHSYAMADLCIKLASRGITITFVYTEALCHCNTYIADIAQKNGLDIRSAEISDGLTSDFDRSLYNESFLQSVLNSMIEPVQQLILTVNTKDRPISCIIADSFLPWAVLIAKMLTVPLVTLWTQSTVLYSLYYHSEMLIDNGHFPSKGQETHNCIDYIPGVPTMHQRDLPSFLQAKNMSEFMLHVIFLSMQSNREADWILANSVYELETEPVEYSLHSATPLYTVGPLLPSEYLSNHPPLKFDFTKWLDSKAANSVLYISFGGAARVSKAQIDEIAMGLLESKIAFIWTLPPQTMCSYDSLTEILPHGYLEQIEDNGIGHVVPNWSHHLHYTVLSHRSIGGFVSNCDWNSVLQSLCMGVPLLGFPLYADQYTNCKLISDVMNIGLKIEHGGINGALVERMQIARKVKALINGKEGRKARKKIKRLKHVARKAGGQGVSSHKNFDNFVEELTCKVLHG
ncbi:hypothetical protein SUGI_0747890 [Cryptomeria japonica]|uniref:UDP-glycosyltransferase 86A2-like n=1 Tax=Cryptomeria japonica TaxID=3369 RepID=UPI002414843A|nr:UDP-glycosyltransferase 86A2-like [Cryptomeria japonica]GLJ36960.1 hypothetical protein SUGI_0747890 [Cryptomeria japonica]